MPRQLLDYFSLQSHSMQKLYKTNAFVYNVTGILVLETTQFRLGLFWALFKFNFVKNLS